MTPGKARFAASAFVVLGAAIVINTLFMQNDPAAIASAKVVAERAAAKVELQRVSQLSVDAAGRRSARMRVDERTRSGRRSSMGRRSATGRRADSSAGGERQARLRQDAGQLSLRSGAAEGRIDDRELVRGVQRELALKGYDPGAVDGISGLMTRAAILAYESDNGLQLTAAPSETLMRNIILGGGSAGAGEAAATGMPAGAQPHAAQVIRTIQRSLTTLGYHHGSADGRIGENTKRAIREFEMDRGLEPTGRVSGRLVGQLAKLAGKGRMAGKRK